MKVGFGKNDITPATNIEHYEVLDPLFARAAVFIEDNGTPALALLSLDLTQLSPVVIEPVRRTVSTALGMRFEHVLIHTTHNHSAPRSHEFDRGKLAERVAAAARQAANSAVTAEISHANKPVVKGLTTCRRWDSATELGDFSILTNDDCEFRNDGVHVRRHVLAQLEELGITDMPEIPDAVLQPPDDSELAVTRFHTPGGEPIGGFVRFSAHVDQLCLRSGRNFSAEYPSVLLAAIEENLGGTFLFLNGTCGDIKTVYERYEFSECERTGNALADEAVSLAETAPEFEPLEDIRFAVKTIDLPARTDVQKDPWGLVHEMWVLKVERKMKKLRGATLNEMLPWDNHRWVVDTLAYFTHQLPENFELIKRSSWPYSMSVVDFGGKTQMLFLQEEVFGEFTRVMREKFAGRVLHTVSLTNGGGWYMVPERKYRRGGYEPTASIYAPEAFGLALDAAIDFLTEFYAGG